MSKSALLSTVLFREHRLMSVLPLGGCFLRKAERGNNDILHDKDNDAARLEIAREADTYTLIFSPEGLESQALARMVNPVLKHIVGEVLKSDEGIALVFKPNAKRLTSLFGTTRELIIPKDSSLIVTLSKSADELLDVEIKEQRSHCLVH